MNHEIPPQSKKPPSSNLEIEASVSEDKLSTEQKIAIKLSVDIGRKIQLEFPQIAIDYINGLSSYEQLLNFKNSTAATIVFVVELFKTNFYLLFLMFQL